MVDQTVLSAQGKAKEALLGAVSAAPQADAWDDPKWQAFVKAYQQAWPPEKRFAGPSLCATNYYDETSAMLRALDEVNGDLSDGQKKFCSALASMTLDAPNGQMKLDEKPPSYRDEFRPLEVVGKIRTVISLARSCGWCQTLTKGSVSPRRRSTGLACRHGKFRSVKKNYD